MKRAGFTLIELLIVVAIIAILAAIAIPNFLEAQTRAKVSRTRADMRTVATGVELYHVDNGRYPVPADEDGGFMTNPAASGVEWYETKTPVLLTTPVAYLNGRPPDIFARPGSADSINFHYTSMDYLRLTEGAEADEIFADYYRDLKGETAQASGVGYFLLGFGPDQDHDIEDEHGGGDGHDHNHGHGAVYDATNGTLSSGDIHYMGPGVGFL